MRKQVQLCAHHAISYAPKLASQLAHASTVNVSEMEGSAASSLLSGWGMLEVVFEFGGSKCPLMVTCESLQANLYEAAKAIRADFKKDLYIMQRYSIHNKLKKKGHVRESHTRDGLLSLGGAFASTRRKLLRERRSKKLEFRRSMSPQKVKNTIIRELPNLRVEDATF